MRILTIVEAAYRATLEEQDDTVLWLSRALKNAGADLTVVLRGNAVNYAVRQSCPPLVIGRATIQHPAQPNEDLAKLQAKGAKVYVIREDLAARGIAEDRCVTEAQPLGRAELVDLMERHGIKRIPIVRDGALVGVVSRADLLCALLSREPERPLAQPSDTALRQAVIEAFEKHAWTSRWPVHVFVHGGYWRSLAKEDIRRLVGASAAVPGLAAR